MGKNKDYWKQLNAIGMSIAAELEPLIKEVQNAVYPHLTPLYKPRGFSGSPELIGTGVLLQVGKLVFVLTAAHVIEQFEGYPPLISHDDKFMAMPGESYHTKRPASGSHNTDPIDASAFRVDGPIADAPRCRCVSIDNLYISDELRTDAYTIIGFPLRDAEVKGREYIHNPLGFTLFSRVDDEYLRAKTDRGVHIVFDPGKKLISRHGTGDLPKVNGMSGGGVWIVPKAMGREESHKLAGIFIENRRRDRLMLATNVVVHLQLIASYHPELHELLSKL